jgi:hypothetical protein
MDKKKIYVFSCGCRYDENQYDLIKPPNSKLRCPKHKKCGLVKRITYCVDCGKELVSKPMGGIPQRCKKCAAKHQKKMVQQYNHSYEYDPDLSCGIKMPTRRPDCKYYISCLQPVSGRLIKNPAACRNCPHYKPGPALDIMKYVKTGGQFPGEKDCLGPHRKKYTSQIRGVKR